MDENWIDCLKKILYKNNTTSVHINKLVFSLPCDIDYRTTTIINGCGLNTRFKGIKFEPNYNLAANIYENFQI